MPVRDTAPKTDADRWNILQSRRQQILTCQAVAAFRSEGLKPLVIKGVAAERYYPPGEYRLSVDVDLAVAPSHYSEALQIAQSSVCSDIGIDVHRGLRRLDTAHWDDLYDHAVDLTFPEGTVKALCPEDDLRVLSVHWLTDGGIYKHRLWDIYHLIDRRSPDFDWDRCLSVVSPTRQRWIDCAAGVAAKYLGLDLLGTPLEGAKKRLPPWFVRWLETNWSSEQKPVPLEMSIHDRKLFIQQFLRRMRPDPVYSTIDCEGSFDARTRFFYETRNIVRRIPASYRRITAMIRLRRQMGDLK